MRFDTLAEIAWFAIRFCAASASGRAISSTSAIPRRCGQNFANSSSGGLAVINVTMRPMNTGMVESSSATTRPEQAFRLAGVMLEEGGEAGRWYRLLGEVGRLQQPFEEREHGTDSRRVARRRHRGARWASFVDRMRAGREASGRHYDIAGYFGVIRGNARGSDRTAPLSAAGTILSSPARGGESDPSRC